MTIILPGGNGPRTKGPDVHEKLNRLKAENIQMTNAMNLLLSYIENLRKRVKRLEADRKKKDERK
jgi:predicted nuclease with TOPRIM domain